MNTEEKIRRLAGLAGWAFDPKLLHSWSHPVHGHRSHGPDYDYSLDAIERDLLPILREQGMQYSLSWNGKEHRFVAHDLLNRGDVDSPAAAAFEAIYEVLCGMKE